MTRRLSRLACAVKSAPAVDLQPITHREFQFKASIVDTGARTFEGLLSVWGPDLGGDVMHKGAFKKTLTEWKKSTDALPLLNSHNHYDILAAVGQLLDAKETDEGLWTKWEVIDGPDGDAVLTRLRPSQRTNRAAVSKMSIGYEPTKFDFEENDQARYGMIRNLREVSLKEGSLVIFPMAPGARIDSGTVKSIDLAGVKSFMASASATEPTSLDDMTRFELRRLASRIGVLLKSSPTELPAAPTPAPAVPATPATPAVPATPPPADDAPVPPTPSDPPATPPAAAPAATTEPTDDPNTKGEDLYVYAEALQQRLLGIRARSALIRTGDST